jgi:anti-anti-sigma factor
LPESEAQIWKSHNFSIEAIPCAPPGTVTFHLKGPFTARDMFSSLSPDEFRHKLETFCAIQETSAQIFDLSEVPYMDSAGLGVLVKLFANSRTKGIRMSITGATPRVHELFKMTKVDAILPIEG